MGGDVYTIGTWKVKADQERSFIALWRERTALYNSLPDPPISMRLTQGNQDKSLFSHVATWNSMENAQATIGHARSTEMTEKLPALCDEISRLGGSQVVAGG